MLRKISAFWLRNINPKLATLIATIGVFGLTICLVILTVLAWLFQEVLEREAFVFDTSWLLWLHQFANPSLDSLMLTITQLGNPTVVVIIVIVVLQYFLCQIISYICKIRLRIALKLY